MFYLISMRTCHSVVEPITSDSDTFVEVTEAEVDDSRYERPSNITFTSAVINRSEHNSNNAQVSSNSTHSDQIALLSKNADEICEQLDNSGHQSKN